MMISESLVRLNSQWTSNDYTLFNPIEGRFGKKKLHGSYCPDDINIHSYTYPDIFVPVNTKY